MYSNTNWRATVVIADIDADTGAAVADELDCRFERCDVCEYDQVETLVEEYGGLDVMVNNAGVASETSVEEMDLDEWDTVIETNLDGVMHGTKAVLPPSKRPAAVSSISAPSTDSSAGKAPRPTPPRKVAS